MYTEDQEFHQVDFSSSPLPPGAYEGCRFSLCNFSGARLEDCQLIDCLFTDCNLSTVRLVRSSFRDVVFQQCKLLGIHFYETNDTLFAAGFEDCQLHLASFYGMKLKKMRFSRCSLQETDFTGADLSGAILEHCDLERAVFAGTILEKADLRHSYHLSIDPERNKIRKAKFSLESLPGLLDKYEIMVE